MATFETMTSSSSSSSSITHMSSFASDHLPASRTGVPPTSPSVSSPPFSAPLAATTRFTEQISGAMYTDIMKQLETAMSVECRYSVLRDGLPFLESIPLTKSNLHLVGKQIDPRTMGGGLVFYVVQMPDASLARRCALLCTTIRSNRPPPRNMERIACLLFADGTLWRVAMDPTTTAMPATWFDGIAVLDAYFHQATGFLDVADFIVFHGVHVRVNGCGFRHRRMLLERTSVLSIVARTRPVASPWSIGDYDHDDAHHNKKNTDDDVRHEDKPGCVTGIRIRLLEATMYPQFPDPRHQYHTGGPGTAPTTVKEDDRDCKDRLDNVVYWIRAHSDYSACAQWWGRAYPGYFFHVPRTAAGFVFPWKLDGISSAPERSLDLVISDVRRGDQDKWASFSSSAPSSSSAACRTTVPCANPELWHEVQERYALSMSSRSSSLSSSLVLATNREVVVDCRWDAKTSGFQPLRVNGDTRHAHTTGLHRMSEMALFDGITKSYLDQVEILVAKGEGATDEELEELVRLVPGLDHKEYNMVHILASMDGFDPTDCDVAEEDEDGEDDGNDGDHCGTDGDDDGDRDRDHHMRDGADDIARGGVDQDDANGAKEDACEDGDDGAEDRHWQEKDMKMAQLRQAEMTRFS